VRARNGLLLDLPLLAATSFSFPGFDSLDLLKSGVDPRLTLVRSRKPPEIVESGIFPLYRRLTGPRRPAAQAII
jgi:hypothetical protein